MNKKLIAALNDIYSKIEGTLSDEPLKTIYKTLEKHNDELGSIIQEMEDGEYDEVSETENKEEETQG